MNKLKTILADELLNLEQEEKRLEEFAKNNKDGNDISFYYLGASFQIKKTKELILRLAKEIDER